MRHRPLRPLRRRIPLVATLILVAGVVLGLPSCTLTAPDGAPAGSSLVFHDDFEAGTLNRDNWRYGLPWYPESGGIGADHSELQWYQPSQVQVHDGAANLVGQRAADVAGDQNGKAYASGMLTTAGKFSFTYGFVQFRARVPAGQGLWPALWLLPTDYSHPPEIDVLEALGQDPSTAHLHYHGQDGAPGIVVRGLDSGWHTYAVNWQPGTLTFYIDGVQRWEVAAPDCNKPMYLLMNLAIGGDYPGPPDAGTPFPSTFAIDDVQVWR